MESAEYLGKHDCSYLKTLRKYELKFICESRGLASASSREGLKATLEQRGVVHAYISLPPSYDSRFVRSLSLSALTFIGRRLLPPPYQGLEGLADRLKANYSEAVQAAVRWNQAQEMAFLLHARFGLCRSVADILRYDGGQQETGCVYFLRVPSSPALLKIGRSSRSLPTVRARQQMQHNLENYDVVFYQRTPRSALVEMILHKELSHCRVHADPANDGASEWFTVSIPDAMRLTKTIATALHFYTKCVGL